jgi:hypothetical protein
MMLPDPQHGTFSTDLDAYAECAKDCAAALRQLRKGKNRIEAEEQAVYFCIGRTFANVKRAVAGQQGGLRDWHKHWNAQNPTCTVTTNTRVRSMRYYKLCCQHPGALGIQGAWSKCSQKTHAKLLHERIATAPQSAQQLWSSAPA